MKLTRLQLYRLLRHNVKLSAKRDVMFEANRFGLLYSYIMMAFFAIEFIAIGTLLGWLAAKKDIPEMMFYVMPFLMALDFGGRFMTQQTPMMLVKPYLLTPVSKYSAIEFFIISQILDSANLIWLTIFLPFGFIIFCGGTPLWAVIGMIFMLQLIVIMNSQWYLLIRTLVNQNILWWGLPAAFYGSIVLPFFLLPDAQAKRLFNSMSEYAFSWLSLGLLLLVSGLLIIINRHLQMHLIYDEIAQKEKASLRYVSELNTLNRFGLTGEYLKLEIKSALRNKSIRSRFIQGICFITFFSLVIAFSSNIYDSTFEHNLWCFYSFAFFGSTNLSKIMCPEGNYIDLLMVYQENTYTLLRAKYYYYCAILILPIIILIPPIATGKFPILMVLAYLLTATGPLYCMFFQMAVYNKTTLPLNEKLTGKNQIENKWQAIVSMIGLFVPLALVMLLYAIFDDDTAYWTLIIIGLTFTLTSHQWLYNIYRRMMQRRYENLEGFHSTR